MTRFMHVLGVVIAAALILTTVSKAKDPGPSQSENAYDIRAREAYILGKPPRISPLKPDELKKEDFEAINNTRKAINLPPLTELPEFIATFARHPALYQAHSVLAYQLFRSELSARDREMVILRTGWLCQAPFEFGEHVAIGKRMGGLTDAEVANIVTGSTAPGWNSRDRALIRAVEELHTNAMITDETWAVLAQNLNERQLIELPILIGQYQGVAYMQNSVRVRLMGANKGLSER